MLRASLTVTIVLQASNWAFFGAGDVERLTDAFHPSKYDVVVVKRGNTSSLAVPMSRSAEKAAQTCCLMAATPGANAHPMPPRPRIRPMYPVYPDLEWSANDC